MSASDLMLRVVAVMAVAAFVAAWRMSPAPSLPVSRDRPMPAAQTIIIETDVGPGRVRARVGEAITLSFEYPGATGYRWWPHTPLPASLDLSREDTTALKPGLPGGPARQQITFIASAPGQFSVDLVFRRSWEPETPKDRRLTVQFQITP